jgi:hypothetical protein
MLFAEESYELMLQSMAKEIQEVLEPDETRKSSSRSETD